MNNSLHLPNGEKFNLTDEHLKDFVEMSRDFLARKHNIQNKTSTNTTNATLGVCFEYCDSNMRQIFIDYKQIHGYVTLFVS